MVEFVMGLPIAIAGSLVIIISVAASLYLLSLFHRRVDREALRQNHDVAGFIYAVITVAYAVILAFVVIVVWENFHDAEKVCQEEANAIGDMRRLAEVFPPPVRGEMEATTIRYLKGVVTKEWETMAHGQEDMSVREEMLTMWTILNHYKPTEWQQQTYVQASLDKMSELNDKRRLRLLQSRSSLPTIMWVLLIVGGFMSVAFSYLFASTVMWEQRIMTAALAGIFSLVLFLIFALDHPFAGDVRVSPEAYEYLITRAATDPPR